MLRLVDAVEHLIVLWVHALEHVHLPVPTLFQGFAWVVFHAVSNRVVIVPALDNSIVALGLFEVVGCHLIRVVDVDWICLAKLKEFYSIALCLFFLHSLNPFLIILQLFLEIIFAKVLDPLFDFLTITIDTVLYSPDEWGGIFIGGKDCVFGVGDHK